MSNVCAKCVTDTYLRTYIAENADGSDCDFCGGDDSPALDVSKLADAVEKMLEEHFEPTESEPEGIDLILAKEGSWNRPGQPVEEILFEHVGDDESLIEEVASELQERWFDWDSHTHKYGDDPYFEERTVGHGKYGEAWTEAERKLRFETRLLPAETVSFLDSVFEAEVVKDLVRVIRPNDGVQLFRARVFQSDEALQSALASPEASLGPPPPTLAKGGRMNAHGISAFYGADSAETALAEVRPPVGAWVFAAAFKPLKVLRLLDLTKMIAGRAYGSLFDPQTLPLQQRAAFLRSFAAKLSATVVPDRQPDEYLITQAISDYLAARNDLDLDGIVFRSVQASDHGDNISLFHKASRVAMAAPKVEDAQLYEWTDVVDFWPAISVGDTDQEEIPSVDAAYPPRCDARDIVLSLDRTTMRIYTIKGVKFDFGSTGVSIYARPKI